MSRYEKGVIPEELTPEAIQTEVERILASEKFARSKRLRTLLRFTVAQTLQGNADMLKEYVIGTEVLKKPDSYDPRSDSLVRVLASRLRVKLKEYYSDGGSDDPLVIEFPKGKYVPKFQRRDQLQSDVERRLRARNAYSQGRFRATRLTAEALAEAATHFEEAVEADPDWAQARIGLANVYAFQALLGFRRPREIWPVVKLQADAALQLDELSADAHICLGMGQALFEWRWHDAEAHFLKAVERDTYSGGGHLWRALACLMPASKMEEACAAIATAQELAPSPFLEEAQLLSLYFSEQYDQLLPLTDRAGDLTPFRQWLRACALAGMAKNGEAIELLEKHDGDARMIATLGYVCGIAGDQDKALEALALLSERRARGNWVSNYDLALIQIGLDNRTEALALLHEALREKEPWLAFLAVDPRLHSLRSHPKFQGLVRRIQLTEAESRESGPFLRESAAI
jgi:tetratricopeptide (TPR) repeat protein